MIMIMNSILSRYYKINFFYISSFFVPWTVLGFDLRGLSNLSLAFIFCLLDIKFWCDFFKKRIEKRICNLLIFFLLFIYYFSIRSVNPASIYFNFLFPAIYCTYVYFNLKKNDISGLLFGLYSSLIFSTFQFLEVNFLKTTFLSVSNLEMNFGFGRFGIVQPTGQYGLIGFFKNIIRVSGPAAEPSFFAMTLFSLLPIFHKNKTVLLAIFVGFVVSFSKVSLIFIVFSLFFLIFVRYLFLSYFYFIYFISFLYLVGTKFFLFKYISREDFFISNPSIYTRFVGGLIFFDLDYFYKIIGVGKYNSCNFVSNNWQRVTEMGTGYFDFVRSANCSLVNFSNIGSLLVDGGLIGLIFWSFWPYLIKSAILREKFNIKIVLDKTMFSALLCWWFLCTLNVYFLTFNIPSFFLLAWIFHSQIKIYEKSVI